MKRIFKSMEDAASFYGFTLDELVEKITSCPLVRLISETPLKEKIGYCPYCGCGVYEPYNLSHCGNCGGKIVWEQKHA